MTIPQTLPARQVFLVHPGLRSSARSGLSLLSEEPNGRQRGMSAVAPRGASTIQGTSGGAVTVRTQRPASTIHTRTYNQERLVDKVPCACPGSSLQPPWPIRDALFGRRRRGDAAFESLPPMATDSGLLEDFSRTWEACRHCWTLEPSNVTLSPCQCAPPCSWKRQALPVTPHLPIHHCPHVVIAQCGKTTDFISLPGTHPGWPSPASEAVRTVNAH